jgi:hypothetical protein
MTTKQVRLTGDIYARLEKLAAAHDRTVPRQITYMVKSWDALLAKAERGAASGAGTSVERGGEPSAADRRLMEDEFKRLQRRIRDEYGDDVERGTDPMPGALERIWRRLEQLREWKREEYERRRAESDAWRSQRLRQAGEEREAVEQWWEEACREDVWAEGERRFVEETVGRERRAHQSMWEFGRKHGVGKLGPFDEAAAGERALAGYREYMNGERMARLADIDQRLGDDLEWAADGDRLAASVYTAGGDGGVNRG